MKDKPGAISAAATQLDEALRDFERAAQTALRSSLRSQKHIDKATTSLNEAAAAQTRVVEELQALMVQFNDARGRYESTAEALNRRGDEIEARAKETSVLVERFEALGVMAKETTESVRGIDPGERVTAVERLTELEARMGTIVEDAQTLHRDAQAADLIDMTHAADSLRQQIAGARNKLALALAKLKPS